MLMSTLMVYETVLYSALLGLPLEMSLEAKKFKIIKDSRIADSRSIRSGESRRVSIDSLL